MSAIVPAFWLVVALFVMLDEQRVAGLLGLIKAEPAKMTVLVLALLAAGFAFAYMLFSERIKLRDDRIADLKVRVAQLETQTSPMAIASAISAAQPPPAKSAELDLETFADERFPTLSYRDNVGAWSYIAFNVQGARAAGVLFVPFDIPIKDPIMTLDATFPLPSHEVKSTTDKFMIVGFSDRFPAGILKVRVRQQ